MACPQIKSQFNWEKCLCHYVENECGPLTEFSSKSWRKFETCAKLRNDYISIIMVHEWDSGPRGGYHRKCYSKYTHKKEISQLLKNTDEPNTPQSKLSKQVGSPNVESSLHQLKSQETLPFDSVCVICSRRRKRIKGGGCKEESLIKCCSMAVIDKLMTAAIRNNDHKVISNVKYCKALSSKINYHKSCFGTYTNKWYKQQDDPSKTNHVDQSHTITSTIGDGDDTDIHDSIPNACVVVASKDKSMNGEGHIELGEGYEEEKMEVECEEECANNTLHSFFREVHKRIVVD